MVAKATFIPCFMEATAVAVLAHFVCGFPWTVGFMVGFLLAAVSLAVIIPVILILIDQGYGMEKVSKIFLSSTKLRSPGYPDPGDLRLCRR